MASLALGVKFVPVSNGTADFVYSAAVQGYRSPTSALTDGKTYRYRAESSDMSEWEYGTGVWSSSTSTLTRATVAFSSTGAKVSFTLAPQVGIIQFVEDVLQFDDEMSLTGSQKTRGQINLGVREVLTSDRTYYVATSGGGGSDSNDGLSSGTPFLTGQKAINVVAALDLSIYNVTIQFANGSYTGNISALPWVGSGTVTLRGDPTTPGNVSINGMIRSSRGTRININGLKMTATSGTQIYVDGGYIYTLNVEGAGGVDFMTVTEQGFGLIGGSWKISGNYSTVLSAGYNSQLTTWGTTLTLAGTPAWSIAFLYMTANGSMNGASMTFAGTGATGPRYNINGNSVCMTAGGSSYFPGNSSGTTTTGGQYL